MIIDESEPNSVSHSFVPLFVVFDVVTDQPDSRHDTQCLPSN
jgi:hypothetical protein